MAKIKIKPNRNFFYGETVLAAGKVVAIEEVDARFFIKSGWAVEVKGKDDGGKEGAQPEQQPEQQPESGGNV